MTQIALVLFFLAGICGPALAQNSSSTLGGGATVGGTFGKPPTNGSGGFAPMPFGSSAGDTILRHRDFTGKPCLEVTGFARPHTINPNLYDHVITAVNSCPQRITIQVCYYQSQDCIPVDIAGDERKQAILGTLPMAKDFRFEFREKF
jgi:hypothetical protein